MNERIIWHIVSKARKFAVSDTANGGKCFDADLFHNKFAELIVEETLKQVDERTYCRGETSWYNDDKDWIRLHFGYGRFAK